MEQMVVMASEHHPPKVSTTMGRKSTQLKDRLGGWKTSFAGRQHEGHGQVRRQQVLQWQDNTEIQGSKATMAPVWEQDVSRMGIATRNQAIGQR